MRFIGSKAALLDKIGVVINENAEGGESVFCDIFSGTGVVAKYFKPKYEIHSNDLLHFSYVIQKATIENNNVPSFLKLKKIGISEPFSFLEESEISPEALSNPFIFKNYAPWDTCNRMYFSPKNAIRIDFIRSTIDEWKTKGLLSDAEYYYLLAGLIDGVPSVSNITGTYGAYLKTWDKRAFKAFEMSRLSVYDNSRLNKSYNMDANKLVRSLEGCILYIDPPYNSRQYAPNYHLLETISRYDNPDIYGVTGMRAYENERSDFCVKNKVLDAFTDLVDKAKFRNILISYSSAGLMTIPQIESVLKKYGIPKTYKEYSFPYRKYKSKIAPNEETLNEYFIFIKKDIPKASYFYSAGSAASGLPAGTAGRKTATKKYIKSPMNYIGGKYKLLPQLLPLFPSDINVFVDMFCGGCNVAINACASQIICNDINSKVIELFECLKCTPPDEILRRIEENIKKFGLTKENEEGFKAFRDYYNTCGTPIDLYTLACYSFNYQFRFNNDLKYNNPFGRNRSQFSENMKTNLAAFVSKLQAIDISFISMDFAEYPTESLTEADFVYCDPPYFITTGTYNDGNRGYKDWREKQEADLFAFLDGLHRRGVRFALSNVYEHKGRNNDALIEWCRQYTVVELDSDYSNSSYNTNRGNSREVLIVNY